MDSKTCGLPLLFYFEPRPYDWVWGPMVPFWLVGEFTTHFRTSFSGWIESDVHWGYDLAFEPQPGLDLCLGRK